MLVMSRKIGQKIKVGDDITITIVEVRGGRIKIGIDAPREMKIARDQERKAA